MIRKYDLFREQNTDSVPESAFNPNHIEGGGGACWATRRKVRSACVLTNYKTISMFDAALVMTNIYIQNIMCFFANK